MVEMVEEPRLASLTVLRCGKNSRRRPRQREKSRKSEKEVLSTWEGDRFGILPESDVDGSCKDNVVACVSALCREPVIRSPPFFALQGPPEREWERE